MTRDLTIVNALGILDNPNAERSRAAAARLEPGSDFITIDERTIADAHASGLTAITITLGYTVGDVEPYAHTLHEIETWDRLLAEHPDDLTQVLEAGDIDRARAEGRVGVVYGFQNGLAIGDDLDRVAHFQRAGVRVIQLTYNQANHLGDGSMAPGNRGLTPYGREVVAALNDARMMVDLSHSGERTCLDAIAASRTPVSINHTGCRAIVDVPRNKTDEELRLVADGGGFVGIYFMPFLSPTGHATAADVVAHLEHAIDVCGEDAVGIGTDGTVTGIDDLDGYRATLAEHVAQRAAAGVGAAGERADTLPFVEDLRGVEQFHRLVDLLEQRGHSWSRIEKVMGRNFVEYAARVW
ncbi:dipeptidase [Nocardioides mangrovi]|uniref:Dipeptidase n=1 Tax=Nocardioides mangrovi TaxID=2874580 RepID=A0ABS7U6F5_9ACTN|nr:membrane dipeptidase [Nocardioides mangrovi]MBZ5736568.1 dipeptidase [Nocardioides mangrovi]